ncbi:MAG: MmgE/PrpD family protein [Betaproteobacteria bacterium]|nr:MmgE/PrpD family protein [Betaproteobacteria bacterium]
MRSLCPLHPWTLTRMETALQQLIERHAQAGFELPPQVQQQARWLVLDTLGCAIAGARSPTVRSWLDAQGLRTDPFGTALAQQAAPSAGAAMAFALAACWDEACEGHARAHGRPGVAALAAIWPWVDKLHWGPLLRALVLGYEVGARMGALLRIAPGMHVDGNWPALGAAAAAATAMGLDAGPTWSAVNTAACQLPMSLYRPIQTGDTARNTYLGHAAMLGQMAAQSAACGITAPQDAVACFLKVAYGKTMPSGELPTDAFEILSAYFKPHAAVRHVHYGAQAALALRPQVDMALIEGIDLWVYEEATIYCGIRQAQTPLQAQFSLSFGVAAALRWGHLNPEAYAPDFFHDPLLRNLERKVTIHIEPTWGPQQMRAARLRLKLRDGRELENTATRVMGDALSPWREADLVDKFLSYAQPSLGAKRAQAVAQHILHAPAHAPIFPPAA